MRRVIKRVRAHHVRQVIIYGVVGGAAALTQAVIYLLLCKINISPLLAICAGTILGMIVSYNGHTRFTFQKTHKFSHTEFIKFAATSAIGFGSNFLWVYALVHLLGYDSSVGVYPQIFFTPGLTFLISKFWAFR